MKSIVVLGSTGAGKSATCKTLTGQRDNEVFKTSDRMSSATYLTKGMLSNWYGREGLERIFVIDTPGLGDSQGRDTKHLAQMILALQTLQYVNVFMLTFNIQKHRMDDNTQAMIRLFMKMFGDGFLEHLVVIFTHWSFNEAKRAKFNI